MAPRGPKPRRSPGYDIVLRDTVDLGVTTTTALLEAASDSYGPDVNAVGLRHTLRGLESAGYIYRYGREHRAGARGGALIRWEATLLGHRLVRGEVPQPEWWR